jgi:hypothetical protein
MLELTSISQSPLIRKTAFILQSYPRSAVALSLFAGAVPWLRKNYRQFLDLGPGGLPYNVFGWLVALAITPLGRETLSTGEYDTDPNKETWLDPSKILRRRDSRPRLGWHIAPHRQVEQFSTEEFRKVKCRLLGLCLLSLTGVLRHLTTCL